MKVGEVIGGEKLYSAVILKMDPLDLHAGIVLELLNFVLIFMTHRTADLLLSVEVIGLLHFSHV